MQNTPIENTDFRGKLFIVNNLSNKPARYVNKVRNNLEKLIQPKDYNLYIQQDYSKSEMRIIADYPLPSELSQKDLLFTRTLLNIPITSKASKYISAAKDVINQFEENKCIKEQEKWKEVQKKLKKEGLIDIITTILLLPVDLVNECLYKISPKWSAKYGKLLNKIGI